MKKKLTNFDWKLIKNNFWNVVAITIIWQLIVYVILSIIVAIFGLEMPVA